MKRLNDITKKDPFKAPEGYFETLPGIVRDRIQAEKESKPGFFTVLKPYLYFASFFLMLAFVLKIGLNVFIGDYHNALTATNQTESVEPMYYEYDMISEEVIYAELSVETANKTVEIPEETIIAYLTQDDYSSILYYE